MTYPVPTEAGYYWGFIANGWEPLEVFSCDSVYAFGYETTIGIRDVKAWGPEIKKPAGLKINDHRVKEAT